MQQGVFFYINLRFIYEFKDSILLVNNIQNEVCVGTQYVILKLLKIFESKI